MNYIYIIYINLRTLVFTTISISHDVRVFTVRAPQVEHKHLTILGDLTPLPSARVFSGVRVAQSVVFWVVFCRSLFVIPLLNIIFCHSSFYGFWLSIWNLQTFLVWIIIWSWIWVMLFQWNVIDIQKIPYQAINIWCISKEF